MSQSRALSLPATFRPLRGRVIAYVFAVLLVACLTVISISLPSGGHVSFGLLDRLAIIVFGLAVAWFLHRMGSVRLDADEAGITVRNLFARRRLDWAEVVGVRLASGDPWLQLDISDGTALSAMAIQNADGQRARDAAMQLARLVVANTPPMPEG